MAGTGATAAVGGIALAIGIATGWWFGATKSDQIAADLKTSLDGKAKEAASLRADVADQTERAKRQATEADARLRSAQKENAELKKALDDAKASLDEARAAAKAKPEAAFKPVAPSGPRFAFPQFGKLSEVDWKSVGENLGAMTPLCDAIMKKVKAGDDMPAEELGKLQQHNGPLVVAALKVMKELPGTGANGSFTHPAFMANAIAATLDAAGKPLSPAQATALEKLGREYSDEDARRLQGYDASTYALQKTYEEAELRRRFFEAAFAALDPEQRDALTPPATKGVLGFDLFSDGLLWATVMRPLVYKEKDLDALVTQVAGALNPGLKIPQEQQDAARAEISKWAHDLPAALVAPDDESVGTRNPPIADVRLAAQQTIALLSRLVVDLKLEGPQADAARKWPAVLVPTPQKSE